MNKRERKPSMYDANATTPEYLTDLLIQGILNLPDSSSKVSHLKSEFLTKFVSDETDPPSVRRQRAINKWLATEQSNEWTNTRLLTMCEQFRIMPHVTWSRFRDKVRSIIADIVGDVPPWESFIGSFSGGASTSRTRTSSQPARKYLGKADVTAPALEIFLDLSKELPGWASFFDEVEFNIVEGNVLFTVPKNTTIDRCACKEPDINMFLQKGLGGEIRRCLRRIGQNLNDQSVNRGYARVGSMTGRLATLDLSSASDSVSSQLVFELMPIAWYSSLNALRSPITIIDGEEHVNEMFSSMGNGFTFELESLLFYSIVKAVTYFEGIPGVVSVYGDDIICPVDVADMVTWVLGVLGFEVNTKKSYSTGSFRESCGGHFDNGFNITPFYLRSPIRRITDVIHMANALRMWSDHWDIGINDESVYPIWAELARHVPKSLWGGRDYSSITQLVSPDYPVNRLLPRVVSKPHEYGSYIHWLNTTWRRETTEARPSGLTLEVAQRYCLVHKWAKGYEPVEVVETSIDSKVIQKYRLRPAVKTEVLPLSSLFLEEL